MAMTSCFANRLVTGDLSRTWKGYRDLLNCFGSTGFRNCFVKRNRSLTAAESNYMDKYELLTRHYLERSSTCKTNPRGIFANNELNLRDIRVYGFDYDYTLAVYKESLNDLIYDLGKDVLVNKYKYPKEILDMTYSPNFAIRGLHYDIENGLLMKIDSFHQIQLGSVYRGLTPLSDEEVLQIYRGCYVPQAVIRGDDSDELPRMKQLNDLFSVPEISLLSNVTEFFQRNNMAFYPENAFYDIQNAVQSIHPVMHRTIDETRIGNYLEKQPEIRQFLERLQAAGKQMFLITNSPFKFVDIGMKYMIGENWSELFDVIIVQAAKPKFFTQQHRPIRMYDKESDSQLWEQVTSLKRGKVYMQGTVKQLLEMTDWKGPETLYFGDQIYSDLADVTLNYGWRTAAVIYELEKEITTLNSDSFCQDYCKLQALDEIIDERQMMNFDCDVRHDQLIKDLFKERDQLRKRTKSHFNPQFGSIFRTFNNPTYFSRRLFRYSDIYMSRVTDLLNYSMKHMFCTRRGALPHEYGFPTQIECTKNET